MTPNRPLTDIHDLIENEVIRENIKFRQENSDEHKEIMGKFKDLEALVIAGQGSRRLMVIRDVATILLIIGVTILFAK